MNIATELQQEKGTASAVMAAAVGALMGIGALWLGLIAPAAAREEGDPCPKDSVLSGSLCIDKYEASVWRVPNPTGANKGLVRKIRKGTATAADLTAGGAKQLGTQDTQDDFGADCPKTGNGCVDVYAVSIPGVEPAAFLTWFQAAAAARNAGKRLPTNAEWQAAALGTPDLIDTGPSAGPCNTASIFEPQPTGIAGCVSDVGIFDAVGNVSEWVADWVPLSTTCVPALFPVNPEPMLNDANCLAGASTTEGPGALVRGGGFDGFDAVAERAGVFAVKNAPPSSIGGSIGFRAVR